MAKEVSRGKIWRHDVDSRDDVINMTYNGINETFPKLFIIFDVYTHFYPKIIIFVGFMEGAILPPSHVKDSKKKPISGRVKAGENWYHTMNILNYIKYWVAPSRRMVHA